MLSILLQWGKLRRWFPQVKDVYIPPIPYDAGLAIGSAQYVWHHVLGNKRIRWYDNYTPYLGRTYDKNIILDAISDNIQMIDYEIIDDNEIINLLSDQNIISVFGGGSESE